MVGKYDSGKDKGQVGAGADAFDFGELNQHFELFRLLFFCKFEKNKKMEVVSKNYISIDPEICSGKPHIIGRRITVPQIAIWHEFMGKSADEIATEFDLSLSEVYAGLVYYFDHRQEMDDLIAESESLVSALIQNTPSKIKLSNSAA